MQRLSLLLTARKARAPDLKPDRLIETLKPRGAWHALALRALMELGDTPGSVKGTGQTRRQSRLQRCACAAAAFVNTGVHRDLQYGVSERGVSHDAQILE
jgi:hypothetical protein